MDELAPRQDITLLGHVAASTPMLAEEKLDGVLSFDRGTLVLNASVLARPRPW